jgi:hypothetical protein
MDCIMTCVTDEFIPATNSRMITGSVRRHVIEAVGQLDF